MKEERTKSASPKRGRIANKMATAAQIGVRIQEIRTESYNWFRAETYSRATLREKKATLDRYIVLHERMSEKLHSSCKSL